MLRSVLLGLLFLFTVSCNKSISNSAVILEDMTDVSTLSYVGMGYARNSVNTTIFRHSSLTSNNDFQFISYYDADGKMILARRIPKIGKLCLLRIPVPPLMPIIQFAVSWMGMAICIFPGTIMTVSLRIAEVLHLTAFSLLVNCQ
jgi:hypothetical protein